MAGSTATTTGAAIVSLVLLSLGFFLGRSTAPEASPPAHGDSTVAKEERAKLEADLATLRNERSDLQSKITELENARVLERTLREVSADSRVVRTSDGVGSEWEAAQAAAQGTEEERAAELVKTLEFALEDGDAKAIAALTPQLQELGGLVAADLLVLLEEADSLFEMEQLAQLLGTLEAEEALETLQGLLERETSDGVRVAAVRALGKIPDASSVSLLVAEFTRESDSPMAPSLAASSLGSIGTPEAVSALKAQVESGSNGMVRAFAVRALSELTDPGLVPFFIEQAQRTEGVNARYRKSVIEAIGDTGDEGAIRLLESMMKSPDLGAELQETAKRAINKLAGEVIYPL